MYHCLGEVFQHQEMHNLVLYSCPLKAVHFGTFDNNILGLAVDKDVTGAGHVATLREVDDQEEAGAGEGVVELVEVLAMAALNHLEEHFQEATHIVKI